jgi:8-oxo-dGTP pyrophosphatase MutT (NUDIX family)
MQDQKIRVKAMCLLIHGDKALVMDGDTFKSKVRLVVPGHFYRVLGGSMNFQETSEEGVRREIREELGGEIDNLEKLDVIENNFMYAGEQNHEIVFLFKGSPTRKELTELNVIHIVEDSYEGDAVWIPIKELLNGEKPLYPSTDYKKYFL